MSTFKAWYSFGRPVRAYQEIPFYVLVVVGGLIIFLVDLYRNFRRSGPYYYDETAAIEDFE